MKKPPNDADDPKPEHESKQWFTPNEYTQRVLDSCNAALREPLPLQRRGIAALLIKGSSRHRSTARFETRRRPVYHATPVLG